MAAYAAGALFPSPGLWLRTGPSVGDLSVNGVQLLLAALMLLLGLKTRFTGELRWREHLFAHSIFWICRIGLASAATLAAVVIETPMSEVNSALLVAFLLPAAGSAAGWILASRSDETLGSSIIGGTTLVSVVATPLLLSSFARVQTPATSEMVETLATGYRGQVAVLLVCLPLLAGIGIRWIAEKRLWQVKTPVIRPLNLVLLLLLNYANACVSLPAFIHSPMSAWSMWIIGLVSASVAVAGIAAFVLARGCRLGPDGQGSTTLCTSMSNTGVGLVLATDVLPGAGLLHVTLIAYTLLQHIIAGLISTFLGLQHTQSGQGLDREKTTTAQPRSAMSGGLPGTKTGANAAGTGSAPAGASGSRNEVISTGESARD